MITGPKGSGKKLIAHKIHESSNRSKTIANIIDFKNLNESELVEMFEEDQTKTNKNLFINSNNGTLIFYNIDSLPVSFQRKILIYLENDNYFENINIKINIKIIAITSKNLDQEIDQGNFIRNLYDRLNVVRINVPPISERREDIIPICNYYLRLF